jgi:hypothetical protein
MSFKIKWKFLDPTNSPSEPLATYTIKVFDKDQLQGTIDYNRIAKAVTLDGEKVV